MVDTPRTLAELITMFADNSTGAIDEQAARDLIVSVVLQRPEDAAAVAYQVGVHAGLPAGFQARPGVDVRVPFTDADSAAFPIGSLIEMRGEWADGTDVYAYLESANLILDTAGYTQQLQQLFGAVYVIGDGDVGEVFGQEATLYQKGDGDIATVVSVWGNLTHEGIGLITTYEALRGDVGYYANGGDVTTAYGLHVRGPTLAGGSTIGTAYGIYVDTMDEAGVTADWNVFSAGSTSRNKFEGAVEIAKQDAAGLYLGTPTVQGVQLTNYGDRRAVLNDYGIAFYAASGDANPSVYFASDQAPGGGGALRLGAGGASAPDVILYRQAANVLKTDDRVIQGSPNSAPTDADLDNGTISLYLDQAGNALKVRAKYSDGTLKTGTVALT